MGDLPYDPTDPMGFRRRAELAKRRSVQQGGSHAVTQNAEAATEDGRNGRQDSERASQPQTKRQLTTSIYAPPKQQQKKPQGRTHSSTPSGSQPQQLPAAEKKDGDPSVCLAWEVAETAREEAARKEIEEEDGNQKRSRPGFW
ncbi:hypothetical protein DL770_009915 [Monosporascus sp. CRB-9-2]|nr:hypothetical protein DL770_009915 [Monosporascus sp. CRB-9-2]